MSTKPTLYYAPDNASLCVRIALNAAGVDHETVLVDRGENMQRSTKYLTLNPNGLIPTLDTQNGVLFETAAILLWVAQNGQTAILSADNSDERWAEIKWLFWLSNTLHPNLRMVFYPHLYGTCINDVRQLAHQRIRKNLDVLTDAPDAGWLDQNKVSALSAYLAPMVRWMAIYGEDTSWFNLKDWPRLLDFARRQEALNPVLAAATSEGLGKTVFSAPQMPNPPEGSAT